MRKGVPFELFVCLGMFMCRSRCMTNVAAFNRLFQRSTHYSCRWIPFTPSERGSHLPLQTSPFHSCPLLFRKACWSVQHPDRIHRLHQRLEAHHFLDIGETKNGDKDTVSLAEEIFSVLAKKGRTWRRLRHLVDLACNDSTDDLQTQHDYIKSTTIADVGCDHGLLAIGLAVSGKFDKVTGIDVSERALQDGALSFYKELNHLLNKDGQTARSEKLDRSDLLPVEFRVGDGLHELDSGEADVICIAGMGVNTMLKILFQQEDDWLVIDKLNCERLLLQPTNSKPRNLILLYDRLQALGWSVSAERIEKLSSRWYVSTRFDRNAVTSDADTRDVVNQHDGSVLPGQKLQELRETDPMKEIFNGYVHHHVTWLQSDLQKKGSLEKNELRWLEIANKDGQL